MAVRMPLLLTFKFVPLRFSSQKYRIVLYLTSRMHCRILPGLSLLKKRKMPQGFCYCDKTLTKGNLGGKGLLQLRTCSTTEGLRTAFISMVYSACLIIHLHRGVSSCSGPGPPVSVINPENTPKGNPMEAVSGILFPKLTLVCMYKTDKN